MYLPDPILFVLLAVPAISLLAYVPVVCYLDLKIREVEHLYWLPLVVVNIPTLLLMIYDGNWLLYVPGIVMIFWAFLLMRFGVFEGADFMFISWISLFLIYNPLSGHWVMVLPFTIYLSACLAISAMWVLVYNVVTNRGFNLQVANGFPMMFPISAALMLTVMLA